MIIFSTTTRQTPLLVLQGQPYFFFFFFGVSHLPIWGRFVIPKPSWIKIVIKLINACKSKYSLLFFAFNEESNTRKEAKVASKQVNFIIYI